MFEQSSICEDSEEGSIIYCSLSDDNSKWTNRDDDTEVSVENCASKFTTVPTPSLIAYLSGNRYCDWGRIDYPLSKYLDVSFVT